jgi:sn-glycerol 3-phosphate transport system permease protein
MRVRRSRRLRESLLAYALILPSLAVFGVFVFFPFAKNFEIPFYAESACRGFGTRRVCENREWVGFDRWRDILGSDEFRDSLWITAKFALMTVPGGIALGLVLAVVAHQRLRGVTIYRTIFSSTVATSAAVASVIFVSLFGPQTGIWQLRVGGIPILEHPRWALPAVAVVATWQSLGLAFIVMSAGLQAIPDDLLEAASVDGAGPTRRFWRVTLPLMSPTLFFAFVVGSISAFKTFAEIDLLTPGGGTGDNTKVLAYAVYEAGFESRNQVTAAVLAVGLFVCVLVLTLLQLRLERRVQYVG